MHIVIDEETCTGCGVCESLCPDVLQVGEDGKAHVLDPEGCNGCDCQEAIDSCPSESITMKE